MLATEGGVVSIAKDGYGSEQNDALATAKFALITFISLKD